MSLMPDKTKTNEDQTVLQLERHASVYIFAKLQQCIYMYVTKFVEREEGGGNRRTFKEV